MKSIIKQYAVILILCIIKFCIPLLIHPDFGLHRDEFLYLAEGNHLAWGYIEAPPAIAFMAFIANALGGSFYAVKFFPALFGALTMLLIGKIVIDLGGHYFAQLLAGLSYLFTTFLRSNILFQPNAFDFLLWTFCFFLLIKYIQTENKKWLVWLAITFGIGLLNKYTIGFLMVAVIAALLITNRKLFADKTIYKSGIITLLILMPNLIWQAQHNFPFLYHMELLNDLQLKNQNIPSFLIDQLLMNLAATIVWITGLWSLFKQNNRRYIAIGLCFILVIAFLILLHGKNYYSLGLYPVLFAFGAVGLEQYADAKKRFWVKPILILFTMIIGITLFPLSVPVYGQNEMVKTIEKIRGKNSSKWEDQQQHALPQDYADMLGWRELTEKVNNAYSSLSKKEQQQLYITCENYGLAGALNYYGKLYKLPSAYSQSASFIFWIPELKNFNTAIYVALQPPDTFVYNHCKTVLLFDSITNPLAVEYGTQIFILKEIDTVLTTTVQLEIYENRKRFNK